MCPDFMCPDFMCPGRGNETQDYCCVMLLIVIAVQCAGNSLPLCECPSTGGDGLG